MRLQAIDLRETGLKALRFGAVGLGVTLLHTAIALGLLGAGWAGPMWANGIAFVTSTVVSYLANSIWSFRAGVEIGSSFRFAVVSLVNFGLTLTIAYVAKKIGIAPQIGVLVIACALPVFSFCLHNFWTFSARHRAGAIPRTPGDPE